MYRRSGKRAKRLDKYDWIKSNSPVLAKIMDYKCQVCKEPTPLKKGTIHHTKYTGHDYKKTVEKQLESNAIMWVCKDCHKREHTAYQLEEVNEKIKNSGNCTLCLDFTWDSWFMIPSFEVPICKKCAKFIKDRKILVATKRKMDQEIIDFIKEMDEEDGITETKEDQYYTYQYELTPFPNTLNSTDHQILETLKERINSKVYGNIKTQNPNNVGDINNDKSQLELF